jgi:hypothetical protein
MELMLFRGAVEMLLQTTVPCRHSYQLSFKARSRGEMERSVETLSQIHLLPVAAHFDACWILYPILFIHDATFGKGWHNVVYKDLTRHHVLEG